MERILRQIAAQGVRDAVLNLHHHPASIAGVVGDGLDCGLRVRYSLEPTILGSAGGPRHALPLIDDDPFLIVNGDTMTDVDLAAMVDAHRDVRGGGDPGRRPEPRARTVRWRRRGRAAIASSTSRAPGSAPESWHFVGLQVANRSMFAGLQDEVPTDSVNQVYRRRSDHGAWRGAGVSLRRTIHRRRPAGRLPGGQPRRGRSARRP